MLSHFRVPLVFLYLGSLLGIFLRWQFITPTSGIHYTFFLHAHSHIMFLGWIFNALYIALCHNHIKKNENSFFRNLFIVLQVFVVGMLIAFPIQGYAFYSILFSTLHTLCSLWFIILFFSKTKSQSTISLIFARIALLFFALSTAGPFALGYLMANDMGQSNWYNFSIYFYLHFQYNGFFLFGVFSVFFHLLEGKKIYFSKSRAKVFCWILAGACLPTYLLSVLWANPPIYVNALSGIAAMTQLIALYVLIKLLANSASNILRAINRPSVYFLSIAMASLTIKVLLQLVSALPVVSQMAYELRPVVIAYLHMVLIGVITLPLLVWYLELSLIGRSLGHISIYIFLLSFFGMELCLVLSPWWTSLFGVIILKSSHATFFFSLIMSASCLLLIISSISKKLTKISSSFDRGHQPPSPS